jgi:hypothetical protein
VDKSNACDIEKVKIQAEEFEDEEFKEDKQELVPCLRLDHSMLYCPPSTHHLQTPQAQV